MTDSRIVSSGNWLLDPLQLGIIAKILRTKQTRFDTLVKCAELDPSMDFIGTNLDCVDFAESDLSNFNFSGCSCRYSNFSKAKTTKTNFTQADVWRARISIEQAKQMKGMVRNMDSVSVVFDPLNRKTAAAMVRRIIADTGIPIRMFSDMAHLDRRTVSRFFNGSKISDGSVLKIIKTAKIALEKGVGVASSKADLERDYMLGSRVVRRREPFFSNRKIVADIDENQMELFLIVEGIDTGRDEASISDDLNPNK